MCVFVYYENMELVITLFFWVASWQVSYLGYGFPTIEAFNSWSVPFKMLLLEYLVIVGKFIITQ